MARCGCSGSLCNCAVVAGPGILVTGTGSASNPYTISDDPNVADASLQVVDTPSVDLTLTGTGIPAAPYTLTADAHPVSTDANNLLIEGSDGQTYLDCEALVSCGIGGVIAQGCGLEVPVPGTLAVTAEPAASFPGGCDPTVKGEPLYCGSDSRVYTIPGRAPATQSVSIPAVTLADGSGATSLCGAVALASYTNNSCLSQLVLVQFAQGTSDLDVTGPNSTVYATLDHDVNTAGSAANPPAITAARRFEVSNVVTPTGGASASIAFNVAQGRVIQSIESYILAAGATINVSARQCITRSAGAGGGAVAAGIITIAVI